jgi:hypothetical protein
MRFLSFLILWVFSLQLSAQTSDPLSNQITWFANKAINLDKPGDQFQFSCKFITEGNKPIKWIQTGPVGTTEFIITSTAGVWKDISKDGKISFQVSQDELNGSVDIVRLKGKIIFTMDMGVGSRYKFEISNYQKTN